MESSSNRGSRVCNYFLVYYCSRNSFGLRIVLFGLNWLCVIILGLHDYGKKLSHSFCEEEEPGEDN